MIEDDAQFEYTIQCLAKMYKLRDADAAEPLYSPELRDDVLDSTLSMIWKLEKEVAEYLATHPERLADPLEKKYGPLKPNPLSASRMEAEAQPVKQDVAA
jgi:hypothetical protein